MRFSPVLWSMSVVVKWTRPSDQSLLIGIAIDNTVIVDVGDSSPYFGDSVPSVWHAVHCHVFVPWPVPSIGVACCPLSRLRALACAFHRCGMLSTVTPSCPGLCLPSVWHAVHCHAFVPWPVPSIGVACCPLSRLHALACAFHRCGMLSTVTPSCPGLCLPSVWHAVHCHAFMPWPVPSIGVACCPLSRLRALACAFHRCGMLSTVTPSCPGLCLPSVWHAVHCHAFVPWPVHSIGVACCPLSRLRALACAFHFIDLAAQMPDIVNCCG